MNAKIRTEGMDRSKIMWIEHYLTDVYGPRPIGSPNHVAAANWAVKTMTSWGMKNAHLEPFTWRGVGWLPGRASGFITSPVKANLKFEAVPWSPSTKGTVSGEVVEHRRAGDADRGRADGVPRDARAEGEGRHRDGRPAADRAGQFQRARRSARPTSRRGRATARPIPTRPAAADAAAAGGGRRWRGGARAAAARRPSLGAAGERSASRSSCATTCRRCGSTRRARGRIPGVIVAQNGAGQIYDDTTPQPPAVILRNDDYGRIFRIIAGRHAGVGRVQRRRISTSPKARRRTSPSPRFPAPTRPTKS